ncbi:unnamed protein product, partial [Sphacelaria rigidula]
GGSGASASAQLLPPEAPVVADDAYAMEANGNRHVHGPESSLDVEEVAADRGGNTTGGREVPLPQDNDASNYDSCTIAPALSCPPIPFPAAATAAASRAITTAPASDRSRNSISSDAASLNGN